MGPKGAKGPHKMRFLTFRKNNMFRKNLVLELWSKILKANQNAGFFKLEYLTNKLKLNFWM